MCLEEIYQLQKMFSQLWTSTIIDILQQPGKCYIVKIWSASQIFCGKRKDREMKVIFRKVGESNEDNSLNVSSRPDGTSEGQSQPEMLIKLQ